MSNNLKNVLLLVAFWLLVVGAGVYLTYFHQPEELERLRKAEQVAQMKRAELTSLEVEQGSLAGLTTDVLRKWRARYKVIPTSLTTAEVVGYFNELTARGFENFDLTYSGATRSRTHNYHTFAVTGRAYYSSFYRFVWHVENSRAFYKIRDLHVDHIDLVRRDRETQAERMDVMVSFEMKVDAYFDGLPGVSAPRPAGPYLSESYAAAFEDEPAPVPDELLPARRLPANPFHPIILASIPPNTYGLVDVEQAELVSIVGRDVIFQDATGYRTVGVGEQVYLGRIVSADPVTGRVVARLNKGGIVDEVELYLHGGTPVRRAQGPAQLVPIH